MNRRRYGTLGLLAVLAPVALSLAGCKSDPLSDLDGNPAGVVTDFSYLQLAIGATHTVTGQIVDGRGTALAVPITFTACTADVAVATDTAYHPVPQTSARVIVTAVSAAPSCVVVSGSGVVDTVRVAVLPQTFGGVLSSTTPKGGDTLTINSTATLKFNAATTTVTFGGGVTSPVVLSQTADVIKLLVPFSSPGPLSISNINVTYVAGLSATLNTAQTVTQTGDLWAPGDTGYASAPSLALPTVLGQSRLYLTQLPHISNDANCGEGTGGGGLGNCTIFKYTANGTDSLQFLVNWTPATNPSTDNSDIDIYSCGSAGVSACFEGGAAGVTGASVNTPEKFTFKPTAGVHYLVIEQYSGGEDINVSLTITKKN